MEHKKEIYLTNGTLIDKFSFCFTTSSRKFIDHKQISKIIKKNTTCKAIIAGDIELKAKVGWSKAFHVGFIEEPSEEEKKKILDEIECFRVRCYLGDSKYFLVIGIEQSGRYIYSHQFIKMIN